MIASAKINYLQKQIARFDDQAAYKELFILFYHPLLQFADSIIRSREQAEEIVSDVFMNVWEKRKRIETITNLRVYLYVAIKNTALNYVSKEHRTNGHHADIDQLAVNLKSIYFNPEQLLITAEMIHRIREVINGLPPRCRIIFKLVKEDELRYKEVAEILSISVKTVENQITIALKKIGSAINFDIRKALSSPG